MDNPLEQTDQPLADKLVEVLNRINVAMRAESWEATGSHGLNPTQGKILMLLASRDEPLRLSEIAKQLSVSAPTVSDSVSTLVEKGLVVKKRATDDARAIALNLTRQGKKLLHQLDGMSDLTRNVISSLPDEEKTQFYRTLIKVVRGLQIQGRVPVSRMCVTCKYFRPNVHDDARRPHHCALVGTAFGDSTLRADCPEHEPADEHLAIQNWSSFASA